ncbi:VirB4 family type IV secretion system protein [uncultured Dysosmobacter sp.]|uniref:VirB4 family type IV secretion system protein n=1 Tax=uncultured Dysosmobacter sp. TaxID=2591384 RepID=UPI00263335B8|nr:type VI secretion protein [uncultured Dysosmobacter sp.]
MAKKKAKKKKKAPEQAVRPKDFLDMIAPAAAKFNTDHFILGGRYHAALSLKSYPPVTDELALLRCVGDMGGVNLRLTARQVTPAEEDAILHAAANKSRMERSNTNDVKQSVTAEANLRDMTEMMTKQRQEKEPLIHCAVYMDITAADTDKLRTARDTISAQLIRSRMGADPLTLRQRDGFLSANPAGGQQLSNFAERVLPARSVANLYPMNYSGKTDPNGFFIGRDRFGSNIIVDLDRRAPDKTNASALILGNTGQGKSFLLKLLLCNVREAGKSVISLDSEHEMEDECRGLGGCFLDYLSGQYRINLLEPRCWDDGSEPDDADAPAAFHGTLLAQHISFLRDVFRVYKGFDTPHIDTLELMIEKLYQKWGISDSTDFTRMRPEDYPILSDLYEVIHDAYETYDAANNLYPKEMLRDLLLGLHSMCKGADSRFFNGHTNIDASKFLVFCVKGLDNVAANLRDTLLFSLLSYMSDQLLTAGNSVAAIDELYLWLSNTTVVTYIRNCLKRVRKKNSALILASQNLEDFDQPGIRELTRPLFSIPVHQFLFNGGNVDKKFFMDNLQLEESEYALIRDPMRGSCLYKCGNERYLLQVQAPDYKKELFGTAGGR